MKKIFTTLFEKIRVTPQRKFIFVALISLELMSCRSGMMIRDVQMGQTEIRKAIGEVLGDPRKVANEGREFISRYHDENLAPIIGTQKVKSRFYTVVDILGDGRPYDLIVETFKESKDDYGVFVYDDKDEELAQKISEDLQKSLNHIMNNRNLIDDFKPF